jgi:hypothetical protein
MSDDLVNQLTLNFLISKNQLQKLNKKMKESTDTNRQTDKEIYQERIKQLFLHLLVNQQPEDLLADVKTGFDFFIDKAVYYFKAKDNHEILEQERSTNEDNNYNPNEIHDDIDYEKEDRIISKCPYEEEDEDEDEEQYEYDEDDEDDEIYFTKKTGLHINIPAAINVRQKYSKHHSKGVSNIESLSLDWFQKSNVNKIIPRTKDNIN